MSISIYEVTYSDQKQEKFIDADVIPDCSMRQLFYLMEMYNISEIETEDDCTLKIYDDYVRL